MKKSNLEAVLNSFLLVAGESRKSTGKNRRAKIKMMKSMLSVVVLHCADPVSEICFRPIKSRSKRREAPQRYKPVSKRVEKQIVLTSASEVEKEIVKKVGQAVPDEVMGYKEIAKKINYCLSKYSTDFSLLALEKADLFQVGWMAANQCLKRYDGRANGLLSLMQFRIEGAIADEFRRVGKDVGRGRGYKNYSRYQELLEQAQIEKMEVEEIADRLRISIESAKKVIRFKSHDTLSIEADIHPCADYDEEFNLLNVLEDEGGQNGFKSLFVKDLKDMIAKQLECLPFDERLVLIGYYYEEKTFKEIGNGISLTESRICQLHSQALAKLRVRIKKADWL